jgi:hypothetical protein
MAPVTSIEDATSWYPLVVVLALHQENVQKLLDFFTFSNRKAKK